MPPSPPAPPPPHNNLTLFQAVQMRPASRPSPHRSHHSFSLTSEFLCIRAPSENAGSHFDTSALFDASHGSLFKTLGPGSLLHNSPCSRGDFFFYPPPPSLASTTPLLREKNSGRDVCRDISRKLFNFFYTKKKTSKKTLIVILIIWAATLRFTSDANLKVGRSLGGEFAAAAAVVGVASRGGSEQQR